MVRALVFASLALGCQVQGQCATTPAFVEYCAAGDNTCQGHIIDTTHWESGPLTGNFLTFGAEQTYHLHFRDAKTGQVLSGYPVGHEIQVGATQRPDVLGSAYIPCGDQLCELTDDPDQSSLWVKNDTCQSYFFRVIVEVSTSADAGTE
jgi:hypothetical protein